VDHEARQVTTERPARQTKQPVARTDLSTSVVVSASSNYTPVEAARLAKPDKRGVSRADFLEAKEQLAERRSAARPHMKKSEGKTYLQSAAVTSRTAESYSELVAGFVRWVLLSMAVIPSQDPQQMSALLGEYLDTLFFGGEQLTMATRVFAAVLFQWPHLGRGVRNSLPLARQALQGWKKLNPGRARLPIHWLLIAALADVLLDRMKPWMALLLVVTFHAYLRPGIAAAIRIGQLAAPIRKAKTPGEDHPDLRWTLNLHAAELERPSKTGSFDETVELGDREPWLWVNELLSRALGRPQVLRGARLGQLRRASPDAQLSRARRGQAAWLNEFRQAAEHLQLPEEIDVHMYRLRHGGASFDSAHKVRTLDEVAKRGAWRSFVSVARYAKPGRVNEELASLGDDVRSDVLRRADRLQARLLAWRWKPCARHACELLLEPDLE